MKVSAAVIGASGYTGIELVRILHGHPDVKLKAAAANKRVGKPLSSLMGAGAPKMEYCKVDSKEIEECEVIFSALPHCTVMERVGGWRKDGKTVIDLSADFRLKNPSAYKEWYDTDHAAPELLKEAVYGMPEIHREELKSAGLIACPGCYPTAAILGLLPAVKEGFAEGGFIVNAVSGVSGAGRQSKTEYSFSELNENILAYGVPKHRHTPEMEQELSAAGKEVKITFTPHLGSFNRGIYATIYADASKGITQDELADLYRKHYENEPFVTVCDGNPRLKDVQGTNFCHVRPIIDERTGKLIILSAIDNLVKGAAGQAVQCFNLRYGFDETAGLSTGPG